MKENNLLKLLTYIENNEVNENIFKQYFLDTRLKGKDKSRANKIIFSYLKNTINKSNSYSINKVNIYKSMYKFDDIYKNEVYMIIINTSSKADTVYAWVGRNGVKSIFLQRKGNIAIGWG